MTGFTRAGSTSRGFLIAVALIAVGAGVLVSPFASASPIKSLHHHEEVMRADEAAAHSWSAYLAAGPSVWKTMIHPQVTPDVRTSIWRALGSDAPETNAWVQFLLWKQSINPTRFARFHPHVAPVLTRMTTTLPSQVVTPTTSTPSSSTPITEPQTLAPTVPEPAAWLLALGMTGWGLRWRRRQRSRSVMIDSTGSAES